MKWSTALPDWEKKIVGRQSLVPCAPLFPAEAAAALDIFKSLKVVDVAGMPTFGEISRPWILDFVAAIFGAYDAESGRRLINEFFLLISKKNGKSTLAAGIMITALLRNWRNSAEYIILAPTIEVAKNSADPAMDMVERDDELLSLLRPIRHLRTIEHRVTKATLKIVAADSETVAGKKAAGILLDELWLFGKMANAENMLREATGGLASRPEGFVIALSTMSDEQPAGVFKDWLKRYRAIRDGKIARPRSLGLLYEFPQHMLEAGSFKDLGNAYVTNPNLGASVDEQFLSDKLQESTDNGASSLVGFFAKHLNVEVGLALRADAWAGAALWPETVDTTLTLDTLLERSEVVVIGIDGGGLDDLLGLAVLGREKGYDGEAPEKRRWLLWCRAWAHKVVLKRREQIATQLEDFAKAEELVIVDTLGDDIAECADLVERVWRTGLMPDNNAIGLDPVGIGQVVDALAERKIQSTEDGDRPVGGVSQGWKLSGAIKTAERKLADGTLIHADQALMTWNVGNAKAEARGNATVITKQAAGSAKIDALMATFNAVAFMSMNPVAKGTFEYTAGRMTGQPREKKFA